MSLTKFPPLPSNIGKVRKIKNIYGQERAMRIDAEISLVCRRRNPDATFALYFQKFKVLKDSWGDDILYRLGYYAIQVRGRNKGKWGWGQYNPMARPEELVQLFGMARQQGWKI